MDDSNNNNSSSNNNHNRRNDDETIKAILSRLSNNDKIVEEVRQLVAENLQLGSRSSSGSSSSSTKNNDTPVIAAVAPSSLSRTHSSSSSTAGTVESKEVTVNEDDGAYKNNNATRAQTSSSSSSSSSRQSKSKTNDDKESEELAFTIDKDSETYHNILSMAKWYRDSFFIGSEYANVNQQQQLQQHQQHQKGTMNQSPRQKEDDDQRKRRVSLLKQQRDYEKRQQHQLLNNNSNNVTPLRRYRPPQITSYTPIPPITSPHNATGYPILSTLFENYITSPYAYNTIHPYATWITSSYGPLYPIASTSLSQSIPLGQSLLNWTCRENLLWLLQDDEWKDWGKSITRGYIMDSDSVGDSSGSDD
jgi:hypothetical protein